MIVLLKEVGIILIGYLLGCFATGYYLVRWRTGQDLRTLNSGATGGRNTGRVLGWQGAVATGLFDVLKGSLAVWIALYLNISAWGVALTVVAVVIGHLYPFQLNFHGGKGLSAAYGAVLIYDWRLALLVLLIAIVIAAITRRVSISFLAAVGLSPIAAVVIKSSLLEIVSIGCIAILILYAHRTNLIALLQPNDESKKSNEKSST